MQTARAQSVGGDYCNITRARNTSPRRNTLDCRKPKPSWNVRQDSAILKKYETDSRARAENLA
ncbi:hypothetical protein Pan258_40320 [Symmachiella dynata]|nr:hypothetical protein Pan258_40320 [Symmachiella dynata]